MKHTPTALIVLSASIFASQPQAEDERNESLNELGNVTISGNTHSHANHTGAHHNSDAPIGVMGAHLHHEGDWMISLRAMRMHMDGNRSGTNNLSPAEVLGEGFMVTPTEMDMDMLMLGGMYAPTDSVTLMVMVPYVRNTMDHLTGGGVKFTTESEGFGDVQVGGLFALWEGKEQSLHANFSVALPTGSIDERDATPANPSAKLPYPMQLGSGTFDFLPGLTWLGRNENLSFGAQAIYTLRTGTNDEHYTLGNRFDVSTWATRELSPSMSASLRLALSDWKNIDGADPELNPAMVPTARPDLQGGTRLDLAAGLSWAPHEGAGAGHRIALEFGVPVYQDLEGPQLETDWILSFGWTRSF